MRVSLPNSLPISVNPDSLLGELLELFTEIQNYRVASLAEDVQRQVHCVADNPEVSQQVIWIAPGILEALIPGRMQSHACTAEVPR
jgi:hypothetical protein